MSLYDVGERIRERRKALGLNQDELAELASLNRVTVAKYESGKVEPGAQALSRIADALEMTVDQILGREPPAEPPEPLIKTREARILSSGVDKMPKEARDKALNMMMLMFEQYKDYFDEKENDHDAD